MTDCVVYIRRLRRTFFVGLLTGSLVAIWTMCGLPLRSAWVGVADRDQTFRHTVVILATALTVGSAVGCLLSAWLVLGVRTVVREFTRRTEQLPPRCRTVELVTASFLGLCLELVIIRWFSESFLVMAYLKNLVLIAAFLGLGLGMIRPPGRSSLLPLVAPFLALTTLMLTALSLLNVDAVLRNPHADTHIWNSPPASTLLQVLLFYLFFLALFAIVTSVFVPIGAFIARRMIHLPSLRAYSFNVLGSLLGVLAMVAVAMLRLGPGVWFGLSALVLCWLLRHHRASLGLGILSGLILVAAAAGPSLIGPTRAHSPYQALEIRPLRLSVNDETLPVGYEILANKAYHLRALDLSASFVQLQAERFPELAQMSAVYEAPFRLCPDARSALILGSGAGNDVAAALRCGVGWIDAVEIDPLIAELGCRLHPEHPYERKQVTLHVQDARTYVQLCPRRYDLIIYGLLDSHSLLGALSSVRVENFVYTSEGLSAAADCLAPNGVLTLTFSAGQEKWVVERLRAMLRSVFKREPLVFRTHYDDGVLFATGWSDVQTANAAQLERISLSDDPPPESATDDWPFLYLRERKLPTAYLVISVALLLLSSALLYLVSGRPRPVPLPSRATCAHAFLLGAAFLLIEAKSTTELAVQYGSTWYVNSVVFGAILVMILLANVYVSLTNRLSYVRLYVVLMALLALAFCVPVHSLHMGSRMLDLLTALPLQFGPLAIAGMIFAKTVKAAPDVGSVLGANLLGAVVGGLTENAAMWLGFRALTLIALHLYGLSGAVLLIPRVRHLKIDRGEPAL